LPVRGRKPLDRMELQSRGPCTSTCLSSTASSSAVQWPLRTAWPPSAWPLLPLPPPRRRAPPGARAIASTLSDLVGGSVPAFRGERLRRRGPYGAQAGASEWRTWRCGGRPMSIRWTAFIPKGRVRTNAGRLTAPPTPHDLRFPRTKDAPCVASDKRCGETFFLVVVANLAKIQAFYYRPIRRNSRIAILRTTYISGTSRFQLVCIFFFSSEKKIKQRMQRNFGVCALWK
jgi:hypothetical protein